MIQYPVQAIQYFGTFFNDFRNHSSLDKNIDFMTTVIYNFKAIDHPVHITTHIILMHVICIGGHPVLFAAEGSHGLWSTPGDHEFIRVPKVLDKTGFGRPWKTWATVKFHHIGRTEMPAWMTFKGKWGNPKTKCVLLKKLGLCEYTEGPRGLLRDHQDFYCQSKQSANSITQLFSYYYQRIYNALLIKLLLINWWYLIFLLNMFSFSSENLQWPSITVKVE